MARPSQSSLNPHLGKKGDKGKGHKRAAPGDEVVGAAKRVRAAAKGLPGSPGTSGSIFAKFHHRDDNFPPPSTLSRSVGYDETTELGIKFFSGINRLVFGYDEDVRVATENAKKAKEMYQKLKVTADKNAAKVLELNAMVQTQREDRVRLDDKVARLEDDKISLQNQVNDLSARLGSVETQFTQARSLVSRLKGSPKKNILDLAEVDGNLLLIKQIQSETPPDLDDEVTELLKMKGSLAGANRVFAEAITDLEKTLVFPLEGLDVASIGVINPTGCPGELGVVTTTPNPAVAQLSERESPQDNGEIGLAEEVETAERTSEQDRNETSEHDEEDEIQEQDGEEIETVAP